MQPAEQNQIQGYVDGYHEGRIFGWAWRPSAPQEALPIEVLVDGKIVAETAAWMPRADLSEAGIGDGRHGFEVPVALDVDRLRDTRVVVRIKDGEQLPPLPGSLLHAESGGAVPPDPKITAFVDSILKSHQSAELQARQVQPSVLDGTPPGLQFQPRDDVAMNFIVFCPWVKDTPAAIEIVADPSVNESVAEEVATRVTRRKGLLARLLKTAEPRGRVEPVASVPAPSALAVSAPASPVASVPTSKDSAGHSAELVYSFVAPAFNALLGQLGKVHVARDPVDDVNRIYDGCVARGENCLLIYYAAPHQMVLGSRCPVMPVFAWDYPDIPTEAWGGEPRNDWRHVLLQSAGAITLSSFAAAAVRRAMREHYRILAAPVPVWDRSPTAGSKPPVRSSQKSARLEFQGVVFDSRSHAFEPGSPLPQPPSHEALAAAGPVHVTLDGVVFAAVAAPRDGSDNWQEILTAFVTEFREDADATLVFKMTGRSLSDWWWELNDVLTRLPVFRCRVVALQDFPNDARYAELIAMSHWIVNASQCEAVCLSAMEFMSAGRPAVTPTHTAMIDLIDTSNAVVVRSESTCCGWPHDARQHFTTLRQSVDWMSLREALREAYRMTTCDDVRYTAMSEAALVTLRRLCADTVVLRAFAEFLGLPLPPGAETPTMAPA